MNSKPRALNEESSEILIAFDGDNVSFDNPSATPFSSVDATTAHREAIVMNCILLKENLFANYC